MSLRDFSRALADSLPRGALLTIADGEGGERPASKSELKDAAARACCHQCGGSIFEGGGSVGHAHFALNGRLMAVCDECGQKILRRARSDGGHDERHPRLLKQTDAGRRADFPQLSETVLRECLAGAETGT